MSHSPHHLALLRLRRPVGAEQALGVIDQLERAGSLDVVDAVRIESPGGEALRITTLDRAATPRISLTAWTWLLGDVLGTTPAAGPGTGAGGLSESFVAELREVLPTATEGLALVVSRLDAAAAVAAFLDLPDVRLVYGVVPDAVLEQLLTSGPAAADGDREPVTIRATSPSAPRTPRR